MASSFFFGGTEFCGIPGNGCPVKCVIISYIVFCSSFAVCFAPTVSNCRRNNPLQKKHERLKKRIYQ
jgi:hypothetical protein